MTSKPELSDLELISLSTEHLASAYQCTLAIVYTRIFYPRLFTNIRRNFCPLAQKCLKITFTFEKTGTISELSKRLLITTFKIFAFLCLV